MLQVQSIRPLFMEPECCRFSLSVFSPANGRGIVQLRIINDAGMMQQVATSIRASITVMFFSYFLIEDVFILSVYRLSLVYVCRVPNVENYFHHYFNHYFKFC